MFKVKNVSLYVAAGLFLLISVNCVVAEDANEAVAKKTSPDPFEQNRRLGRGINLGNALDAPNEGEWGVTLKKEYFKIIKDAGFDSVRIPCRWSNHALENKPYTIDKSFFDRVDWAIENAIKNDLYVMLNIHHYNELLADPDNHTKRFYSLWQQIAEHYKDYPDSLLLELLNEPSGKIRLRTWNQMLKESLSVVRKSNPHRTVVVGPYNFNRIGYLNRLEVPEHDRNIIASVHYYEPYQFTHQGAEWSGERSKAWMGTTWTGTDEQKHAIIKAFDRAVAWRKKHNRPINLGEFGAYEKADMASRVRWTEFVVKSAVERGWSFHYWEFCSGFGAYDQETNAWREPLLKALIQPDK